MSKERTSSESSNGEQTSGASDSVFQQQHTATPAERTSLSDTTLQDLPIEMLECILVEAIAMEVKGMKFAKSVWKQKADLVISRLKAVCSQWNIILTTDFFRNEVHRKIDGTAPETIRLEILHQFPRQSLTSSTIYKVIAMKDEIFMLCMLDSEDYVIKVYDRNNMVDVKDVIPLPGICVAPNGLAACSVSNSVYVQHEERQNEIWVCLSVWRITRDEKHQFHISPWLSDLRLDYSSISVSGNGNVIIFSVPEDEWNAVVSIYNANASLQHEVLLSQDILYINGDGSDRVIQKSNGNLLLVSLDFDFHPELTEIDITGRIIRQYKSSLGGRPSRVEFADTCGRILISDPNDRMELLDSEFNHLEFTGPQLVEGKFRVSYDIHYNRERNEIMGIKNGGLTIFRFTEE